MNFFNNFINDKVYRRVIIFGAFLLTFSLLFVYGCTIEDDSSPDINNEELTDPQEQETPDQEEQENINNNILRIALYFADEEAVINDQRGEFGYVTPVSGEIPYTENQADVLKKTIEKLISGPDPEDTHVTGTIPETTSVLSVIIENNIATVDLSAEVITDSPGGILGGTIFIESMLYTATQFPVVEKLLVLVEGEPWEDGHQVWSDPLSADER